MTSEAIKIGAHLDERMRAVLAEIVAKAEAGELCGLLVTAEFVDSIRPITYIRGRYDADPFRALMAMERAKFKLSRQIDNLELQDHSLEKKRWLK